MLLPNFYMYISAYNVNIEIKYSYFILYYMYFLYLSWTSFFFSDTIYRRKQEVVHYFTVIRYVYFLNKIFKKQHSWFS